MAAVASGREWVAAAGGIKEEHKAYLDDFRKLVEPVETVRCAQNGLICRVFSIALYIVRWGGGSSL